MYLGYFVTTTDAVYVLDARGIIVFIANFIEKWINHDLATDGVIFDGIVNNQIIKLSCKMESDPQLGLVESLHFC